MFKTFETDKYIIEDIRKTPLNQSMKEIRAEAYLKGVAESKQKPVSILIQSIALLVIGGLIGTILAVQI